MTKVYPLWAFSSPQWGGIPPIRDKFGWRIFSQLYSRKVYELPEGLKKSYNRSVNRPIQRHARMDSECPYTVRATKDHVWYLFLIHEWLDYFTFLFPLHVHFFHIRQRKYGCWTGCIVTPYSARLLCIPPSMTPNEVVLDRQTKKPLKIG